MRHSHVLDIPLDGAYKVDPIAHCQSLQPFVDTTAYHGIKVGDTERWVMSLRPVDSSYDSNNSITWNDVVEQYRNIFMTEITQEMKITAIAGDIYQGMTQKEVDAFVIRQIEASLELLPEADVNGMYQEIVSEIAI